MRWIALTCFVLALVLGVPARATDIEGTITARGARHAGNTVVYIEKITGKVFEPPKESVVVDQKHLTFTPYVIPVLVGTTVEFHNSDEVMHNVFTPDQCAEKFHLGTWPRGEVRSFTFDTPCSAALLCNVHPEMEAFVVTVETPYFALTGKDGKYVITGVPPGSYTLKIWHPQLKAKPVAVTVPMPEARSITQDFIIHK